ncbi:ribosome modulation factor [Marinobacter fonticola]|uniref:ribosome modulation factor n=1 Tax=Marinobacter fonticola TaxID=2603215 RepID=UPI0011E81589|nr:ribosome modulation factor [Marinobacter fonticola]
MARDIKLGWDVDSLNKAYRQGYMAAVMGMSRERCPYRGDVVVAAWEAGWEDGQPVLHRAQPGLNDRIA